MAVSDPRHDIPVLLLHNIDPCWLTEEIEEAVAVTARLEKALRGVGHPVTNLSVTADDLPRCLGPFPPERFVVFNWCEELPGIPHSDAVVARILRMMGFTFTGSSSSVLELSWDKEKVKRFLEQNGLPAPLTDEEYLSLQRICLSTYRAYGCRDYARLDLRLRDGVFFILDINPNPDISFDASMACAAESVGISYGDMGSRLVCLAARRHPVFGKLV